LAEVPTFVVPKLMLVLLSVTAARVPVPVSGTVCGLFTALSVMERLAVRVPLAVGLKVSVTVHVPLTASVLGLSGHVLVWEKSPVFVPLNPMAVIVSGAVPVLVTVTDCVGLLVPTDWLRKVRLVGLRDTAGAVPVPLKDTVWGLPAALSAMEMLALRLPVAPGLKVTEMLHVLPAARVLDPDGQVLV
jgi:hypothetical protein